MKSTTSVTILLRIVALAVLADTFCVSSAFAMNTQATNASINGPDLNAANAGAPAVTASPQQRASTDEGSPAAGQRNPRYKICQDDVLSLTFPIAPEFDQDAVTVMPDGYVNLQAVGSVYVLGLTVPDAVEAIKKAYSVILRNPIVVVDLTDFQKPHFVVLGQVGKPGQYDLRYDMSLMQAVAVAGGFAPTAKTQLFLFRQISPTTVEVTKLNVKEVLNGQIVNEETHLSPGDTIFVPEKTITKFRKYVPYSVDAGWYPSEAF
jgi:polysaccharide export outer membrane protein